MDDMNNNEKALQKPIKIIVFLNLCLQMPGKVMECEPLYPYSHPQSHLIYPM